MQRGRERGCRGLAAGAVCPPLVEAWEEVEVEVEVEAVEEVEAGQHTRLSARVCAVARQPHSCERELPEPRHPCTCTTG
jgi:hypothetical protein